MDTRDDVEDGRDGDDPDPARGRTVAADRASDHPTDRRDAEAGGRSDDVGEVERVAPGVDDAVGDERRELGPLEPGSPTAENVLFVVLGALSTVLLFATAL